MITAISREHVAYQRLNRELPAIGYLVGEYTDTAGNYGLRADRYTPIGVVAIHLRISGPDTELPIRIKTTGHPDGDHVTYHSYHQLRRVLSIAASIATASSKERTR